MALVVCADCGNTVSDQAASCPYCGRPAPVDADASSEMKVHVPRGDSSLLLMAAAGVLLATGLGLLLLDKAAWASACLLTGIVLGVGGRFTALIHRRKS